jgi:hypothetical protein
MMDIKKAQSAFAINLYKWANACLCEEMKGQFSLLRQFRDAGAESFLTILDGLPSGEQHALTSVLLRYRHAFAAEELNEPVTAHEKVIIESYKDKVREVMTSEWAASGDGNDSGAVPTRRIRQVLSKHIGDRFGQQVRSDTPGIIRVERRFADMLIVTCFSTGGQFHKLAYWHQVERRDGLRVAEFISILGLFGVNGMTGWQKVPEKDIAQVLSALDSACLLFQSSVPALLSGLE